MNEETRVRRCQIPGCEKKHNARGLCAMHYYRWLRYERLDRTRESHGKYRSPEYKIWTAMKQRCGNRKCSEYRSYGGRGIAVCDRWSDSFSAFIADMGERPGPEYQIDRIDNDGNYEPENCRWATPAQNSQNQRSNVLTMEKAHNIRALYALKGVSYRDLAINYGVSRGAVQAVLENRAWKEEESA